MSDYNLVSAEPLLSRLSDELSSYSSNGVLDQGKLLVHLKWYAQLLNIAIFEEYETIVKLENHRAELPCDFFLLDSAWLCEGHDHHDVLNFQAKISVYTEVTSEIVGNDVNCSLPNNFNQTGYLNISACNMDKPVYDKVTTTEWVKSNPSAITWRRPILLSYVKGRSAKKYCSKNCSNLFCRYPDEISINREGDSYYLYSTLKDSVIYVKYYALGMDEETNTPLIPDDAILQENLYKYLLYQFFKIIYLNGDDNNLEGKMKLLKQDADEAITFSMNYGKLPKFSKMVQLGRRSRRKFASFEIMSSYHY